MQILHFPPTAYFLLPRLLARIGSLIYGEPLGLSRGLRESDVGPKTEVSPFARHVRSTLESRHRQAASACPFRAMALNRCAIARGGGRGAHQYGSTRGEMVSSVWVILS